MNTPEDESTELSATQFEPQYILDVYVNGGVIARKYNPDSDTNKQAHLFTADEILMRVELALRENKAVAFGALL